MNKFLKTTAKWVLVLGILYVVAVSYSITNGFRDYKKYCSKFIPKLEQYHKSNGVYPDSLEMFKTDALDFRYSKKECGYDNNTEYFSFYFSDGFIGVIGYDSKKKMWWFD